MGLAELFTRATTQTLVSQLSHGNPLALQDTISPDWTAQEYRGGMGLPGAWRASILLSDLLGGVPWDAYRTSTGSGVAELVSPTPSFLEQPSPPDARVVTFSSMMLDLLWHGNAIAVIAARNREGWPTAYLPVPADMVQVKRVEAWDDIPLPLGEIAYGIGTRWYPAAAVVHVKGPCAPGALRGLGVIENHLHKTLRLAEEQAQSARSLGSAGVPSGLLKVTDPEFEQEDANALKAKWLESQRTRTVAVLNATTDFQPLSWNPSETQLLEARKFSLHETALIFGLDPSWLGVAGASMTYSNVEQEAVNLVKFSLNGHLQRFEQTFSLHMPRGTVAKANLDAVLRADTLTRYTAHEIGIRAGFLTDDEARALENRRPLTPAQRAKAAPPPPAAQDPNASGAPAPAASN